MTLENLARIGRLQPHAATTEEIRKLLAGAARSLKDAGNTSNSNASRLTLAYTVANDLIVAGVAPSGHFSSASDGTNGVAQPRHVHPHFIMVPLSNSDQIGDAPSTVGVENTNTLPSG